MWCGCSWMIASSEREASRCKYFWFRIFREQKRIASNDDEMPVTRMRKTNMRLSMAFPLFGFSWARESYTQGLVVYDIGIFLLLFLIITYCTVAFPFLLNIKSFRIDRNYVSFASSSPDGWVAAANVRTKVHGLSTDGLAMCVLGLQWNSPFDLHLSCASPAFSEKPRGDVVRWITWTGSKFCSYHCRHSVFPS